MIKVIAQIRIERSWREEVSDADLRCIELSRGELGVVQFDLGRSTQDDCCFMFDELFQDEAAKKAT